MKSMKRIVAALLVLTMMLALAVPAMAIVRKVETKKWFIFTCDAHSYTCAKSSGKTNNVVQKGSTAERKAVSGCYTKLRVNEAAKTDRWFKTSKLDVAPADKQYTKVVWAKGGKGMSTCLKNSIIGPIGPMKGKKVKVSGHTNLRKNPGMKFKSQGVVEKGCKLTMTGRVGCDDRDVWWVEIKKDGKKLWLSENFIKKEHMDWIVEVTDKFLMAVDKLR